MEYSDRDEKGYPWLFFHATNQWKYCLAVSLLSSPPVSFLRVGTHISNDMGGDSFAGLFFAIASTVFMFLAAISISSLRRRSRERTVGGLNGVLNCMSAFGVISLVLVFFHAFGNYRSTHRYLCLYAMIALVICGFIGRLLKIVWHPASWQQKSAGSLTLQGEDRVELILNEVHARKPPHFGIPYPNGERFIDSLEKCRVPKIKSLFFLLSYPLWRIFQHRTGQ